MAARWCLFPADCSRENPSSPISSWQPFNNPIKQKWKGDWSQRDPGGKGNSVRPFTGCSWNNSHCRDEMGAEGPKPPWRVLGNEGGQCQEEPNEHRTRIFQKGQVGRMVQWQKGCYNPWALEESTQGALQRDLGSLISQIWALSYCSHSTILSGKFLYSHCWSNP